MNKIHKFAMACAMVCALTVPSACATAQTSSSSSSSSSLLGNTISNIVQGVFTKSNLTIADIAGQWTADGSAVSFQSDNFLQKAGGLAAAGAIENQINPYYEKLGLNNAVLTIQEDGSFTLKSKVSLSGTIKSNGDGTFDFTFKALNLLSLGTIKAYVQKSGNHLDVMFDATKLKTLISGVASISGISIAKTAASLLDSYEGLCVGFSMNKTGSVATSESSKPSLGSVIGNILGGSSSSSSTATPAEEEPAQSTESTGKSLGGALMNILKSTTSE